MSKSDEAMGSFMEAFNLLLLATKKTVKDHGARCECFDDLVQAMRVAHVRLMAVPGVVAGDRDS